jgi:hypothetical protein
VVFVKDEHDGLTPQERYHKKNTRLFTIRLVETTEKDIIDKLNSVPNKSGYVKDLIRKDLAAGLNGKKKKQGGD